MFCVTTKWLDACNYLFREPVYYQAVCVRDSFDGSDQPAPSTHVSLPTVGSDSADIPVLFPRSLCRSSWSTLGVSLEPVQWRHPLPCVDRWQEGDATVQFRFR
jgi:hypothetical protein